MSMKQLDTLYRYEKDREQKAAQQLQIAEQDYQQNIERLRSVGEFRLEYMKRLTQRSSEGIDSATFSHFHAFVAKLDQAGQQVKIAMHQAKAMVEHKKQLWFLQRQKLQAVEVLKKKKLKALEKIADKREQNMFDEIATQQFIRRKLQR